MFDDRQRPFRQQIFPPEDLDLVFAGVVEAMEIVVTGEFQFQTFPGWIQLIRSEFFDQFLPGLFQDFDL